MKIIGLFIIIAVCFSINVALGFSDIANIIGVISASGFYLITVQSS